MDKGRPDTSLTMRMISNSPGPKSELTSIIPFPARFMAWANQRSSACFADRLGVFFQSRLKCFVVLDVVNPIAPAVNDSSSSKPIDFISLSVGIAW